MTQIKWNPIQAPDFTASSQMMANAQDSFDRAGQQLQGMVKGFEARAKQEYDLLQQAAMAEEMKQIGAMDHKQLTAYLQNPEQTNVGNTVLSGENKLKLAEFALGRNETLGAEDRENKQWELQFGKETAHELDVLKKTQDFTTKQDDIAHRRDATLKVGEALNTYAGTPIGYEVRNGSRVAIYPNQFQLAAEELRLNEMYGLTGSGSNYGSGSSVGSAPSVDEATAMITGNQTIRKPQQTSGSDSVLAAIKSVEDGSVQPSEGQKIKAQATGGVTNQPDAFKQAVNQVNGITEDSTKQAEINLGLRQPDQPVQPVQPKQSFKVNTGSPDADAYIKSMNADFAPDSGMQLIKPTFGKGEGELATAYANDQKAARSIVNNNNKKITALDELRDNPLGIQLITRSFAGRNLAVGSDGAGWIDEAKKVVTEFMASEGLNKSERAALSKALTSLGTLSGSIFAGIESKTNISNADRDALVQSEMGFLRGLYSGSATAEALDKQYNNYKYDNAYTTSSAYQNAPLSEQQQGALRSTIDSKYEPVASVKYGELSRNTEHLPDSDNTTFLGSAIRKALPESETTRGLIQGSGNILEQINQGNDPSITGTASKIGSAIADAAANTVRFISGRAGSPVYEVGDEIEVGNTRHRLTANGWETLR